MYLYHFGFRQLPFALTPDTNLFCALPSHLEAFNTLKFSLLSGEAFCKITGEVGSGKTLLCRLLINKIHKKRKVAYIPNPVLSSKELKLALANELNIRITKNTGEEQIIPKIQKKLVEINEKSGSVILIIDEAQAMPEETLETLRLFTNLETEKSKLIQIVLFGQPELNEKLEKKSLRQLRQRIAFSYQLKPLNYNQTKAYIIHRLKSVSNGMPKISFSVGAYFFIHYASRGIPRLVNVLSHKSIMLAYGKSQKKINVRSVFQAIRDTEDTWSMSKARRWIYTSLAFGLFSGGAFAFWGIS
ncbi:ExeA family protein [Pleionea sediminis]|uniref:ExeA family protein n=1 Tax=Pleionea sediminis TaxID=2569479 RepID=UPI00118576CC|nr:AAA family ATPase [Pleionea sediminis]